MTKPNVLIVEDDPIIAADLEDLLDEMGYGRTATVASGEAALLSARQSPPQLVLLDIQLEGELDGIDTANRLAVEHPVPVIFLTSNTDKRTFGRAKATQPHAFLSKPFRPADLQHAIELAMSKATPTPPAQIPAAPLKDRIFIKSKDHMEKVMIEDILWVAAEDYYCSVVTAKKKHLATMTLKKFSEGLETDLLVRCHRSYMVNLNRVDRMSDHYLYIGRQQIPIGKAYRNGIKERLQTL